MKFSKHGLTALAFGSSFLATTAMADVSAQDVWARFEKSAQQQGYSFSKKPDVIGSDVLFDDVVLNFSDSTGTRVEIRLDSLEFLEKLDGSVAIEMPDQIPFDVTIVDADGGQNVLSGAQTSKGFTMVARGDANDMTIDYSGAEVNVTLVDTLKSNAPSIEMRIDIADVTGRVEMRGETAQTAQGTLGSLAYVMDIADPDGEGGNMKGTFSDIVFASTGSFANWTGENARQALEAGDGMSAVYSIGKSETNFDFADGSERFLLYSSARNSEVRVSINQNGVIFDTQSNDVSLNANMSGMPFPVSLSLAKIGFGAELPLLPKNEKQRYGMNVALVDLELDERIWQMFDPTNALPHDPLGFKLDLSGDGVLAFDLMDPKADEIESADMGQVESVTINALELGVLGVKLFGEGGFTFDNSDMDTFDGFPRPEGRANLKLTGMNAALEGLMSAGLLQPDQAMMPRMMLGMFARPVGDDAFETDVKIDRRGEVRVNGQRMR